MRDFTTFEYEYEPLDELIATPPFTRCACYFRYTYGCLAGWRCHAILHASPCACIPQTSSWRDWPDVIRCTLVSFLFFWGGAVVSLSLRLRSWCLSGVGACFSRGYPRGECCRRGSLRPVYYCGDLIFFISYFHPLQPILVTHPTKDFLNFL